MCGPNVQIYAATHSVDPAERAQALERAYPITIGDDVGPLIRRCLNPQLICVPDTICRCGLEVELLSLVRALLATV